uniref:Uncharacterized protein n=1 Tax=Knipowitschia caucasica TaxID=637954 RepID=A0AAV2KA28_KNICA
MGAERRRLTTGHLSRAISVGAEARSRLSALLIVKISGNQLLLRTRSLSSELRASIGPRPGHNWIPVSP